MAQTGREVPIVGGDGYRRLVPIAGGVVAAIVIVGVLAAVIRSSGSDTAAEDTTTITGFASTTADPACEPGAAQTCDVDLGDDLVLSASEATVIDNGDGTLTVTGPVELETDSGGIPIDDAELIIIPPDGDEPAEIVGGTGDVPFPTIGFLEMAELIGTSTGLFGTDYGRDLAHLGAFVNPDTRYLWITFSDGMNVDTGFAEAFPGVDTSSLPSGFNVPLGVSGTMVIDPLDPYIYIGGACPEFDTPGDDDGSRDETDGSSTTRTTDTSSTTTTTLDDEAEVTIGPEEGAGEDCGIGFSLNGRIPFTPPDIEGLPDTVTAYTSHIVINGEVPLASTGLTIDGVTFQRLGEAGYRLDGLGEVLATVPFIDGLIDVEIPMGDAAAGLEVTIQRTNAYAAGAFGGTQEPLVLPLPIPIEIPNEQPAEARITGAIAGERTPDGVFRIDPGSRLEIVGSNGVGASAFAEVLAIEVEDFQTTTGRLILDRNGAYLEASTNFGVHPSIDLGAGSAVTAQIDATSLENSFIALGGVMRFAAIELDGRSAVRLDRDGLRTSGRLATAAGFIDLDGFVGPGGIDMQGSSELAFPADAVDRLTSGADDALQGAIDDLAAIDAEIERITAEIRAERRERSSDFQTATAAVDLAQRDVDTIDDDIGSNDDQISSLEAEIADVCSGTSGVARAACLARNAARIAGWTAEIAALETANLALQAARAAARVTLDAARLTLEGVEAALDAIPLDADPRIVALTASRDTAEAVLDTTRAVVGVVGAAGNLRGVLDVRLGTSGLSGDASVDWCEDGSCEPLAGADVEFAPAFRACLEVFGIPDICAEF